jgi:transposase InsO family protein
MRTSGAPIRAEVTAATSDSYAPPVHRPSDTLAADAAATAALRAALARGDRDALADAVKDGQPPLLLAVSGNGPQMRSHSTREFMAGVAIAQHFGRPSTPTDQAWIETLFGHVKGEWPHLEKIIEPAAPPPSSRSPAGSTTASGCTPGSATSPPTTNTKAAATPSAGPAATAWPGPAWRTSTTVETKGTPNHEHDPRLVRQL